MLKKMKKYIAVLLTVTLICSFGLTGCGTNSASNSKEATAENPMVLTLAHGLSESHTVHIAMLQFAEEVKQKTNGRIIIKIFPNGQLGSETENLEQLQAGVIAMTKVSAPGLATYNDAYNTFGLPYIFSNIDEFYKIINSTGGVLTTLEASETPTRSYIVNLSEKEGTQKLSKEADEKMLSDVMDAVLDEIIE